MSEIADPRFSAATGHQARHRGDGRSARLAGLHVFLWQATIAGHWPFKPEAQRGRGRGARETRRKPDWSGFSEQVFEADATESATLSVGRWLPVWPHAWFCALYYGGRRGHGKGSINDRGKRRLPIPGQCRLGEAARRVVVQGSWRGRSRQPRSPTTASTCSGTAIRANGSAYTAA